MNSTPRLLVVQSNFGYNHFRVAGVRSHHEPRGQAMFKKLQVAAILLCMLSNAAAGPDSSGTVTASGDMHVDKSLINGNATLFDGSVVETGLASADLRLGKGTNLTMSSSSRGTLYHDHIVLQQGETELTASSSFQLEANGVVRITPNEPNSRGIVSIKPGNTVEVASLSGSFGVRNESGVLVANVRPGKEFSFAMQAGAGQNVFSGVGLVTFENGGYYLTTDEDVKYLLTCKDSHRFVGDKVVVTGTISGAPGQPGQQGNGQQMLCVKSMDINGPGGGLSNRDKWLIAGLLIGAGTGLLIYFATQPKKVVSPS